MNIHITNLYNLGGTATLAQSGVTKIAKSIGIQEMSIRRENFFEDYWNTISHNQDGSIAALRYGDIVIFQYPSWNGTDYDKTFVNKIKAYIGTKLIIFVQDVQKLMADCNQHMMDVEIGIFNNADLLILPSEQMYKCLLNNGLHENIPVLFQKIWEMPGLPSFKNHCNIKRMVFTGNSKRFPFVEEYHGKIKMELFDGQKPNRYNDASFVWRGFYDPDKLMYELSKGGYGLVWCDEYYFDRYYSINQPHKLGFILASGIPVIVRKGCVHEEFIENNGLGFAVKSLNEAEDLISCTTDEEYYKMIDNISKYQYILLNGIYTKKILTEAVIEVLENN